MYHRTYINRKSACHDIVDILLGNNNENSRIGSLWLTMISELCRYEVYSLHSTIIVVLVPMYMAMFIVSLCFNDIQPWRTTHQSLIYFVDRYNLEWIRDWNISYISTVLDCLRLSINFASQPKPAFGFYKQNIFLLLHSSQRILTC